jgi:hypothetical protein
LLDQKRFSVHSDLAANLRIVLSAVGTTDSIRVVSKDRSFHQIFGWPPAREVSACGHVFSGPDQSLGMWVNRRIMKQRDTAFQKHEERERNADEERRANAEQEYLKRLEQEKNRGDGEVCCMLSAMCDMLHVVCHILSALCRMPHTV